MLSDVLRISLVLLAFVLPVLAWIKWPRSPEPVTGIVFGLGFVIGFLGFMLDPIGLPDPAYGAPALPFGQRVVDALFGTIQLMVLGVDADETRTWLLSIARVLMPMAVAQGLILVLARLGNWQLRVRLMLCPPTTLVLGCGQSGARLARFYADLDAEKGEGTWYKPGVVVVDQKREVLDAAAFAGLAVQHLHTSPHAEGILGATRAAKAKRVVICTGDDSLDYALLKRLCAHLKSRGAESGTPEIVVSVDSGALDRAALLDEAELRQRRPHLLNVPRLEARGLLQDHPPHVVVPFVGLGEKTNRFQAGRDNPCHVAIVGEGKFVEELAAHAVRALVYDPNTPLRVTVLTPRASDMRRRFFARYPALSPSANRGQAPCYGQQLPLAFVTFAETDVAPVNANALIAAHAKQRIDVIYVAGSSDDRTLALSAEALKVADVLPDEKPGVVMCRDLLKLASKASGDDTATPTQAGTGRVVLHTFDLSSWQTRDPDRKHPEDNWDRFAFPLWRIYEAFYSPSLEPRGTREWRAEAYDKQWWNRCSGDHSALKVMLLARGREIPEASRIREALESEAMIESAPSDAPETMLVWFQRLEHRRYVRERLVDGWLRRPGQRSSDPKRDIEKHNDYLLNPTLKPFDALDIEERVKDRIMVQAMTQAREELLRRQT